jgi:glycosyltransferase involved in cell wall biosynthesis
LAAIAKLRSEGLKIEATLAGGGELERYKGEAATLQLGEAARFLGLVSADRVAALLASADAFVLPSHEEGLPMAILEALSARVPVVATPVGSIPEVLEHNKTCLFVTPGSVDELADAIRILVTDPQTGRRLAENGRRLYERDFDFDEYMARLLDVYGQVLDLSEHR